MLHIWDGFRYWPERVLDGPAGYIARSSLCLLSAWKPTSWFELEKASAHLPVESPLVSMSSLSWDCTSGGTQAPAARRRAQ